MKKIFLILSLLLQVACTPSQVHQDIQIVEEALNDGEQLYDEYNNPVATKKVTTVKKVTTPVKGFRQQKLQRIKR